MEPVFLYYMKRYIIYILATTLLIGACARESSIVPLAKQNMPALLEREMAEYMGTVEKPLIKDLQVVYQCDSMCVIQAHVSAKDAYGKVQKENIRYFFIKDTFASSLNEGDVYCHKVTGAVYLDKKGIKKFQDDLEKEPQRTYIYYLAASTPIYLFND